MFYYFYSNKKRTLISHQRHLNTATQNNYFISLKISLSHGGKCKVPLAVRRVGHGLFDYSLNISHCLTLGGGGALLLSTSVTDSLLPLTLQHRTCSCTIKVRELQSDDSNGQRWECKWCEKREIWILFWMIMYSRPSLTYCEGGHSLLYIFDMALCNKGELIGW